MKHIWEYTALEGVILALFLKSDMLGLFFWWGWFPDCETTFGIPDGQKENGAISFFTPNFGPKICFFLRYAHIPNFFGLRQTRLNGVISSSYPEVTLDTFGFPVGARSAARRAIFWPRLPKMALFVANNTCRLQRS